MNDIPGVNDHIGARIKCVYVRNREREIAYSLIGIWDIQDYMGVRDLRDDHLVWPELRIAPLRNTP
jgi:hypothetical protein